MKDTFPDIVKSNPQEVDLFFKYFIDFPHDNMVTTYKWDLLTHLFGPFDMFSASFQRIALGRGFLGLVNRIQAEEILSPSPNNTLLIRFSRTEPDFLAFSAKDKTGKLTHTLNRSNGGATIPVYNFVNDYYPNYKLVNQKVEIENALSRKTLSAYAARVEGYFSVVEEDFS